MQTYNVKIQYWVIQTEIDETKDAPIQKEYPELWEDCIVEAEAYIAAQLEDGAEVVAMGFVGFPPLPGVIWVTTSKKE